MRICVCMKERKSDDTTCFRYTLFSIILLSILLAVVFPFTFKHIPFHSFSLICNVFKASNPRRIETPMILSVRACERILFMQAMRCAGALHPDSLFLTTPFFPLFLVNSEAMN